MIDSPRAAAIMRLHDRKMAEPGWAAAMRGEFAGGVWRWIEENHRYNSLLWDEEDKARRTDVDAREIAHCKRLIDRYNQQRNDAVEAIDETILAELDVLPRSARARLHSETAGAMIDRLSILCLKVWHMRQQTLRDDAGAAHVRGCEARLARLNEQRADLGRCLDELLADVQAGRCYFKVYRQFKMYNDPTLNPYLYGKAGARSAQP